MSEETPLPRTFEEAEQVLARTLPGYESRSQQQQFAWYVEQAVESGRHLIAEAGCGVGKSLGYLIPAVLSGKRVIVSTATRALQDQIANKDIPFLAANLGVSFTYALLKGRSNYFCVNKAREVDPSEFPGLAKLLTEATDKFDDPEFAGERDDFDADFTDRQWMMVAADSEDCQAYNCKRDGLCYAQKAKDRALDSRVVIVNHALYLTDLMVFEMTGGAASLLPQHDVVVFDEAHELEEYAGKSLGSTFREGGIRHLTAEVRNFARRYLPDAQDALDTANAAVLTSMQELWNVLEPGRIRQATLLEHGDEFVNFANALADLHGALLAQGLYEDVPTGEYDAAKKQGTRLVRRAGSAMTRFHRVVTDSFDDLVRWVEFETRRSGEKVKVLKTSPVEVAPYLRDNLFGRGDVTAILVSATMSVESKFDYIASRLGIDEFDGIDVGTPFDYEKQACLYVPQHLPEPTPANREAWGSMMTTEVLDLIRASEGRALVLFTSNKQMRDAYEVVSRRVDYKVMMQGQRPNKVLAEEFLTDRHSVLFATRSFMTGVDFQGDTCSLVIIDKLPFPVPTEPLTEARCEAIKRRGGSDFREYTIPVMSLVLKQAFGRLIRHRNDRGAVAILDPRLLSKGYGKTILRSLPPAKRVAGQVEMNGFFAEVVA